MSYMSELDAAITEARGVSRIDLVECELSNVKDQRDCLLSACEAALTELLAWEMDPDTDTAMPVIEQLKAAIAKVKPPERDAEIQK